MRHVILICLLALPFSLPCRAQQNGGSISEHAKEKRGSNRWDYLPLYPERVDISDVASYLKNNEGEEYVGVRGRVMNIYNSGAALFLDLFPTGGFSARPSPLTIVVFQPAFDRFPNPQYYHQRVIQVVGKITEYEGQPQIIVRHPRQIAVSKDEYNPSLLSKNAIRMFIGAIRELRSNQELLRKIRNGSPIESERSRLEYKKTKAIFDRYYSLVMQYWGYCCSDIFEDLIFISLDAIADRINSTGVSALKRNEMIYAPASDELRLRIGESWSLGDILFLNGFVLWWYENTFSHAMNSKFGQAEHCSLMIVPPSCFSTASMAGRGAGVINRKQFIINNEPIKRYEDLLWAIVE